MYSDKVRQLVAELPNRGELRAPTHEAQRDNPICGDVLRLTLEVDGGVVRRLRFRGQGCTAALASASALAFLCEGKTVASCLQLRPRDIVGFLEGLPPHKLHGPELALETLKAALTGKPAS